MGGVWGGGQGGREGWEGEMHGGEGMVWVGGGGRGEGFKNSRCYGSLMRHIAGTRGQVD